MNSSNRVHSWKMRFDELVERAQDNIGWVVAGIGILALIGGGLYGYRYLSIQKEQAAHTILSDCMAQFDLAAQGKAQWADVATMCQAGYEKFSATKVSPYILAVQIDALLAENKPQEALEKLNFMLSKIGNASPLYPLYELKQALLMLDMPDVTLNQTGLDHLEKLSADSKNIYTDAAQFYLGFYYSTHDNASKAKEIWKALAALNESVTDKQASSPWASLAQEKLNGLS